MLGFGTIEGIINWFMTEERKEALAKIILNDDELRSELRYDNATAGDLNYFALAKVGVLLFADYIHDTKIANGPGWIQSTWTWLMTLRSYVGNGQKHKISSR